MNPWHDRLWLWAHQAGSHDGFYRLPAPSTIAPAAATTHLGLDNVLMVCLANEPRPPFGPHAEPLRSCHQLVWSIVGDSSSTRNNQESDLEPVIELSLSFPNLVGGIMDDFFLGKEVAGEWARWPATEVARFRQRLHAAPRPLDLWAVAYDLILGQPIEPYLAHCDVVTYWTWEAKNLVHLEENFARLEQQAPHCRKVLGCYMWDYGGGAPMPLELMQHQLRLGEQWLREGRVEGLIFLASCLCDLDLETVNYTRRWIAGQP